MSSANTAYVARDLAHVWHPCTQMKDHEQLPPIPVRRGEGAWLEDYEGKRYLDAISSWWVNLFGHANPRINAAVRAQLEQLEQVILAGFTHEPVIALSEELCAIAPAGLTRCFYADNGSSAVEVAVKMSFHFWHNTGRSAKRRFLTLSNSYHGETLGALAVGNVELYKEIYRPLLMDVITVPSPDCFQRERGESPAEYSRRQFAHMEAALGKHAQEACAVIVEPLVQCAGGMRMYDPVYLTLLREACDRHQVHLIADEIAVGFGRTGTMFACEQAGIRPDFMCLSKGLTGGYLPLSAVMTTEAVYAAFYDEYVKLNAFLHSHSFTGNPLGCAAARASLAIFRDDHVLEANRTLAARLGERAGALADHPHVAEVRQRGMILAIELAADKASRAPYPWQERRGLRVYRHALTRGVLLRPIGNVVYFMPPYVITPAEIDLMVEVAREGIESAAPRATSRGCCGCGPGRRLLYLMAAAENTRPPSRPCTERRLRSRSARHRRSSASPRCRSPSPRASHAASAWISSCRRRPSSGRPASCRCSPSAASCVSAHRRQRASSSTGAPSPFPPASRAAATACRSSCRRCRCRSFYILRARQMALPAVPVPPVPSGCCSHPPAPRASMRYRARPTPSPCSSAPRADSLTPSSRRPWRRASSRCASVPGCCAPRPPPSPRSPCCSGSSGICRGSGH